MSYRCESKKNIQLNQIVKIQTAKKATHASIYGHHFACDQSIVFCPSKPFTGFLWLRSCVVNRISITKHNKPPLPPTPGTLIFWRRGAWSSVRERKV